ncbi:MAG: hypothetical protein WAX81_00015 [Candidatus Moraniibacteriota bacterium]
MKMGNVAEIKTCSDCDLCVFINKQLLYVCHKDRRFRVVTDLRAQAKRCREDGGGVKKQEEEHIDYYGPLGIERSGS